MNFALQKSWPRLSFSRQQNERSFFLNAFHFVFCQRPCDPFSINASYGYLISNLILRHNRNLPSGFQAIQSTLNYPECPIGQKNTPSTCSSSRFLLLGSSSLERYCDLDITTSGMEKSSSLEITS